MRRLVWRIAVLTVIWCVWWAVASAGLQFAVTSWFTHQRSAGWVAGVSDVSQHGFPFELHARLRDFIVADPSTGVSVDGSEINLLAAAYWPGFVTVKLPESPLEIGTPTGRYVVTAKDAQADLRLRLGVALQLQSMGVVSGAWQIDAVAGDGLLSAEHLQLTMTQDATSPQTYQIDLNVTALMPGEVIRGVLSLPADWPPALDEFAADLRVAFDVPWDRTALTIERPQPRAISVRQIEASWGGVKFMTAGDLTIDPSGVPHGELSISLTNWRSVTALAEASGGMPDAQWTQTEIFLSALANMQGGSDDLDFTLSFQNGEMALGPIHLGPAPRLILH